MLYKVLLVEDEEMIRKGLRYTFDWLKAGCVVIDEAGNGEEGLLKIRKLRPDIVIADINMPLMNGITMIEQSIEDVIYSCIIISGYDEFHLAKKAIHLGVSEYLLKPVDQNQLHEALDRAKKQVELKKKFEIIEANRGQIDDVLSIELASGQIKTSKHVAEMIRYIQVHFAEKISIQDLVVQLDMSATYLNQKFKSETSHTFNEFLTRYRIQQAMSRLKKGEDKVHVIASEVGFKDYKYFSLIFKKYANCTPSQFQEYFNKSDGLTTG